MVLVQKWPVFQVFFLGNIRKENVFYDIVEPKKTFLASKNTKFKKVQKLTFFHAFGLKMAIFRTFFFR